MSEKPARGLRLGLLGGFVRQLRPDLAERHFQFGLVEEIALMWLLFATGAEASLPRQAQLFFHQRQQLSLLGNQVITLGNDMGVLLDDIKQLRHRCRCIRRRRMQPDADLQFGD